MRGRRRARQCVHAISEALDEKAIYPESRTLNDLDAHLSGLREALLQARSDRWRTCGRALEGFHQDCRNHLLDDEFRQEQELEQLRTSAHHLLDLLVLRGWQ